AKARVRARFAAPATTTATSDQPPTPSTVPTPDTSLTPNPADTAEQTSAPRPDTEIGSETQDQAIPEPELASLPALGRPSRGRRGGEGAPISAQLEPPAGSSHSP